MFRLKDDPRSLIRTERDIRALDLGTHFVPLGDEEEYCECIVAPGDCKDDKVIIMVWGDDFFIFPYGNLPTSGMMTFTANICSTR
jgi:hypothetical protein